MAGRTASGGDHAAVETDDLTKVFGSTRAVDGVTLSIPQGCVYGLLGPNGAGKTTVIRMLATLLRPDGGTARVFGHDVVREAAAVRRRISLTAQFASVDEDLTAAENLILLGRLLGYPWRRARERATRLLEEFGLGDAGGRQVAALSGGMRRRLDIAASLIVTPDLLFLDEPTTGLDPRSRSQVWDIIRTIVDRGTTVLLTTQYLDEADRLADRIAVIDHGTVIAEGTSGELKASVGAGNMRVRLENPSRQGEAEDILASQLGVAIRQEPEPGGLSAQLSDMRDGAEAGERIGHAMLDLSRSGISISDIAVGRPSLDEVFLALTGQPVQAAKPGGPDGPGDPGGPVDPGDREET